MAAQSPLFLRLLSSLSYEQGAQVIGLMAKFNNARFGPELLSPIFSEAAVNSLGSVCKNDEDVERMLDFTEQLVHYHRLHGYFFAYTMQRVTQKIQNLSHIRACIIYSDAQINLNDDQSIHSAEVAYNTFLSAKNAVSNQQLSEDQITSQQAIENKFISRLKLFHRFFSRWYNPIDPKEYNPITANLYYLLTRRILSSKYPDLKFNDAKAEEAFLTIINQCDEKDAIYHRILARRHLGNYYLANKRLDQAIEQLKIGLEEALKVDLEAEIGHFYRLLGYIFMRKWNWQEAVNYLFKAYNIDAPMPLCYWRSLDARELAFALRMGSIFGVKLPSHLADLQDPWKASLAFYRSGRFLFDTHMGLHSMLPISIAIKLQMFRCYTENAVEHALQMKSTPDLLGEIEANSPRDIVHVVAEMRAAQDIDLPATSKVELRQAREVFNRHLNSIPETFEEYKTSLPKEYRARHTYLTYRRDLGNQAESTFSDVTVEKILNMRLPNTSFLLFSIGRSSAYSLINLDNRTAINEKAFLTEQNLRNLNEKYVELMRKAIENSSDSTKARTQKEIDDQELKLKQQAIDFILSRYEELLTPILEPLLKEIKDKHLVIFPRLQMNAVPLHALKIGGKRLIEHCDVSYNQNFKLFLNIHKEQKTDLKSPPLVVYNTQETWYLKGCIRTLKNLYKKEVKVVKNSSWEQLVTSFSKSKANDIFFACHGSYDPNNPLLSYLRLSPRRKVSFSNIFSELDLSKYRSVILAACESGLVKTELAAEYLGLPSAFLASGVRYVIGSLWEVNEFSTSILFSKYFELLNSGNYTLPQAFNEAQRQLMTMPSDKVLKWVEANLPELLVRSEEIKKLGEFPFTHPFYWAGFYLSGDV
jgi:CHAT domain-containing protein